MARKDSSINLVGENINFVDRFITWALTVGRVVIILTEVIALGAFLYRFSLDRQLIDLHSKIKQEQAVVSYLKDNEDTFRNIQNRLSLAANFGGIAENQVKLLGDMVSFAPSGMVFNNIAIQEDRIRINASTNLVSSLSEFVKKLRSYSKIENVIIEKIENKPSSASITFGITALLKQNAKTK